MMKQNWCRSMIVPSQSMAITTATPNKLFLKRPRPPLTSPKGVRCFVSRDRPPPRVGIKNPTCGARILRTKDVDFQSEDAKGFVVRDKYMFFWCGLGYVAQGFRCFPWLVLNFHMTHGLGLNPSTLQLIQNFGNIPMLVKPVYGIFSDVFPIFGARRVPYICIGVVLQILSWVPLALSLPAALSLGTLSALILLGNLGASVTEVGNDALVAEFGNKHSVAGIQAYPQMASSLGVLLGNLPFLTKAPARTTFLFFSLVLALQLVCALLAHEEKPVVPAGQLKKPFSEVISKQISELGALIGDRAISRPLVWIMASIIGVPSLSGTIFCYQTQCLNLDRSIIGGSRVVGQVMLVIGTLIYNILGQKISMRELIRRVQILYAGSLLLDLVLARQVNLKFGISNEAFALCFSGLAETVAQFKVLCFSVLFAGLCPVGREGSVMSFVASALCLSSILSGVLGILFAHSIGITCKDYSNLSLGILFQFVASLVPLLFIRHLPDSNVVSLCQEQ